MRGIYSSLTKIRRKVFVEVAKLAYEGNDYSRIEDLPYKIIPGEVATYRDSIFFRKSNRWRKTPFNNGLIFTTN